MKFNNFYFIKENQKAEQTIENLNEKVKNLKKKIAQFEDEFKAEVCLHVTDKISIVCGFLAKEIPDCLEKIQNVEDKILSKLKDMELVRALCSQRIDLNFQTASKRATRSGLH